MKKTNLKFLASLKIAACLALTVAALAGCAITQAEKDANQAASKQAKSETIVLREGDVLKISFPGSANLDTVQPIRRDGKMTMPLIGEVDAAGLTPDGLREKLMKLYASQITSTEIIVMVQSSSFPVFVTGAVIHPGKILSDHPLTALEAVMEAGGFEMNTANMKAVKVSRMEKGVMKSFTLDLKSVLEGKDDQPFYLKPQDIIYVPERLNLF